MSHYDHEKHVAAGLKAAIHNPNVSDEARERAQERLEQVSGASATHTGGVDAAGHETNRVIGGYKATLHNPNVSEEAKQHAREVLKNEGVATGDDSDDVHKTRVNAGYKAALHNPHVSEEAKEHAREVLKSQGEL